LTSNFEKFPPHLRRHKGNERQRGDRLTVALKSQHAFCEEDGAYIDNSDDTAFLSPQRTEGSYSVAFHSVWLTELFPWNTALLESCHAGATDDTRITPCLSHIQLTSRSRTFFSAVEVPQRPRQEKCAFRRGLDCAWVERPDSRERSTNGRHGLSLVLSADQRFRITPHL